MTDMSILSFFEHFHISPVKVCYNYFFENLVEFYRTFRGFVQTWVLICCIKYLVRILFD